MHDDYTIYWLNCQYYKINTSSRVSVGILCRYTYASVPMV